MQEPGRDIGSGSFNIAAIAEAFAEAADMLSCALRQPAPAPASAAHAEAAAWAAVQARNHRKTGHETCCCGSCALAPWGGCSSMQ